MIRDRTRRVVSTFLAHSPSAALRAMRPAPTMTAFLMEGSLSSRGLGVRDGGEGVNPLPFRAGYLRSKGDAARGDQELVVPHVSPSDVVRVRAPASRAVTVTPRRFSTLLSL